MIDLYSPGVATFLVPGMRHNVKIFGRAHRGPSVSSLAMPETGVVKKFFPDKGFPDIVHACTTQLPVQLLLYFRTSLNLDFRNYSKSRTGMYRYMKYACTCQSNFWYTFEMSILQNLTSRYLFCKEKKV